jgi:hypothetical protein
MTDEIKTDEYKCIHCGRDQGTFHGDPGSLECVDCILEQRDRYQARCEELEPLVQLERGEDIERLRRELCETKTHNHPAGYTAEEYARDRGWGYLYGEEQSDG